MKNVILILATILSSCVSGSYRPNHAVSKNIIQQDKDKEEYDVIIIDNNFDRWMATNSKPANFYSEQYYRAKNNFYASAWNSMVNQRSAYRTRDYPFEEPINYDPSIDYGLEVNYKLFWYFKYIESVYGRRYNFPNG